MSRPCRCDRCDTRPGAAYRADDCRPCWLYHHDERYRRLWGPPGWGDLLAVVFRRLGIAHLAKQWGRATGRPCGCQQRQETLNRLPPPAELWRRARGWLRRPTP